MIHGEDSKNEVAGSPHGVCRTLCAALAAGVFMLTLAACSGGGGAGGAGGAGGGANDNTSTVPDDRTLGGGPNGTGTVPHVVITHELPGGDPALDQAPSTSDLGG